MGSGRRRPRTRPSSTGSTGLSLVGTHDLVELCRLLHETVARQMDATIFFLGLYDVASQTVEVVWQVENGKELSGGSFPLGKGITTQVVLSGEPRLIRRWSSEGPRYGGHGTPPLFDRARLEIPAHAAIVLAPEPGATLWIEPEEPQ